MLRETSAASTRSRSTSAPARAAAGTKANPAKKSVRMILSMRIAAPHRASPRKTAKTRRLGVYTIFEPGLIRDNAAWRERDLDQRAGVRCALDAEVGAVGLGQRLGQRQAKTVAAGTPASRDCRLLERFERRLNVLFAHADAGVAHAQHRLAGVGEYARYDHLAAGAGEPDRVRQQIEHDLAQRSLVGDDERQVRRQRGADDDTRAVGLRLHDADALLGEVVEIDVGEGEIDLAGLDLGKIEEIVEHRHQMRPGAVNVFQIFAIALVADRREALGRD